MQKAVLKIITRYFILHSLLFSLSFNAQNKISSEEAKADLAYLHKYFKRFHPDPFKYISRDSLSSLSLRLQNNIRDSITVTQLRLLIRQYLSKIGCGHIGVSPEKSKVKAPDKNILPLDVFVSGEKVFLASSLNSDSTIKPGDEILSIDQNNSTIVLNKLMSISFSDGYNTTFKLHTLNKKQFRYFYSFAYGYNDSYDILYRNTKGEERSAILKGIPVSSDTLIEKKEKKELIFSSNNISLRKDVENNSLFILDIDRFLGKKWRKTLRKSIKHLRKKNATDLIIDLRNNGGGSIIKGINLLSRTMNKPIAIGIDRRPNLLPLNFRLKMGFWQRITPLTFLTIPTKLIRHWKLRHFFIGIPRPFNRYKGNVYVLVNGGSFSMSSICASYLKYKRKAIIIGEETGGNKTGSNAMNSGKLILPNSKANITIPLYHIYYNPTLHNDGKGVEPDHKINYEINDVLNKRDLEMEKVRSLIRDKG